jgi:hypothetical protein
MALTKNIKKTINGFSGELIAENAYIKVFTVSGDKNSMAALVTTVCNGVQISSEEYIFQPNLNGENFIAQAYKHLKTLPEFAGATDC